MTAVILGFFAGTLSVLSPCVLPVLPIVVASALQRHAHGPLAVATGFILSSTGTGLTFAAVGFSGAVDRDVARTVAATVMVGVGVALLVSRVRDGLARIVAPLASGAGALTTRLPSGVLGQAALGALLGVVWTPCTGPALAAAVTLAARSENIARATAVMLAFGAGAAVPVLLVAYGSRRTLAGHGRALVRVAAIAQPALGVVLLAIGALTATGVDRALETWMLDHMPAWMVDLATRL
jgi:cytochrome c biogenesis protein CcdA